MKARVLSSCGSGASPARSRVICASSNSAPLRMRTSTSLARERSASGTLASMKSEMACRPPRGRPPLPAPSSAAAPVAATSPANSASARPADSASCAASSGREPSTATAA